MCFQTRLFPFPHNANGWFPYCHASLSPTEDAQICKLVIIALVIHVTVICEHVCIWVFCCFSCTMPALSVSAASYHVVVKELIEGNRIRLVKLRGYYSNIGFSEAWISFFWIIGHNIVVVDVLVTTWPRASAAAMLAWIFGFESLNFL